MKHNEVGDIWDHRQGDPPEVFIDFQTEPCGLEYDEENCGKCEFEKICWGDEKEETG